MALDFMAIVSGGTYPTPTPSGALRAAQAVTRGLWIGGALPSTVAGAVKRGLFRIGLALRLG